MEIIVHQAILHVLDTTLDAPVLSGSCMEMTAEKTAYLQYHIEKLLASDDIRQCRPLPDSAFRYELEQNKDFIDLSCRIAGVLFDYMHAHTTIPGADLAVVDFTRDGQPWLGILKLNYKNGYTHYTESVDGAPVNSIIQQRACLPTHRNLDAALPPTRCLLILTPMKRPLTQLSKSALKQRMNTATVRWLR